MTQTASSARAPLWLWCLLPAVIMSLGWGLRGYIGGGPLGAMIPGAFVALSLCLLLGRPHSLCGLIAAFGAVGVGFGGQETYGQTVGLSFEPATFWWAITGFAIKGAVWGMLGGAVMGAALAPERLRKRDLMAGFGLMALATYIGWKALNEPKLIYFSNRFDKPRAELWFGLLLGALALLLWLWWRGGGRVPARFLAWGALGGGVGFAAGAWIQVVGRQINPTPWLGWWKVMELTFGACLGLSYGYCAWRSRAELELAPGPAAPAGRSCRLAALGAVAAVGLGLFLHPVLPSRLDYTIVGAALLSLALASEAFAWQIAITLTYCAFAFDLLKNRPEFGLPLLWAFVAVTTLAVAVFVASRAGARARLLVILWTAVGMSMLKALPPPAGLPAFVMEGLFAVMAVVVSWWVWKRCRE